MLLVQQFLTRVFTVQFNSGLAFLAISTTFLGLGSAGVCVYVLPRAFAPGRNGSRAPQLALAYALALVASFMVLVRFNTGERLDGAGMTQQVTRVMVSALLALPALFLVGLVISLVLQEHARRVNRLYGADLAGGGIGCLLVLPLMKLAGGDHGIFVIAALAAAGAALLAHAQGRSRLGASAWLCTGLLAAGPWLNRDLDLVDVRSHRSPLAGVENWVREDVELQREWNELSRLGFFETVDGSSIYVRIDSSCQTSIPSQEAEHRASYVESTDFERLPFVLDRHRRCLEIGAGGGRGMVLAEAMGAESITGVEINPGIVSASLHGFPGYGVGPMLESGRHRYVVAEGRSWALGRPERFDSVTITFIQTGVASSSAAFALSEANLFTVEAFDGFLDLLDEDGLFYVYRHGGNECLRLISMARTSLERLGVRDIRPHLFIARNPTNRLVMLIARSPLSERETRALADACAELDVEILWTPSWTTGPADPRPPNPFPQRVRELRESGRLTMATAVAAYRECTRDPAAQSLEATYIQSPDPQAFLDDYLVDVRAPSDDRPYFFFTGLNKLSDFGLYFDLDGVGILGGTVVLLFWMGAAFAALVLALILFPLALRRGEKRRWSIGLAVVAYFSGLGLGYIAVQISFIQRFSLFLGHPAYAVSVVLLAFLVSSGLGSLSSDRLFRSKLAGFGSVVLVLAGLLVVYNELLPRVFASEAIGLSLPFKVAITFALVLPLAFLMGVLFPQGIRLVERSASEFTPWAWGVNSAASILGSISALILAIHFGFSVVALTAAAIYVVLCLPSAALLRRGAA
jgi:hypothetical protein